MTLNGVKVYDTGAALVLPYLSTIHHFYMIKSQIQISLYIQLKRC